MQQFFNLPTPILTLLALLSLTSLAGGLATIDRKLGIIVMIGGMVLAVAIGIFQMIRGWIQKRRAASLTGDLQQHSGAAPSGINDAGQRARLDDLRRSFTDGLGKFGGVENVYKFPWYLIVGEPGSGKTEAIRHCNVGFPPGLQNELQGVGGTINMNWWFTNQAVFLDTAGRLMFEEVRPGETNEWKEFLGLLKRNRPNCPVNGLMLVIPAEALIKDSDEQLNQKAGKIAQQFDIIQRTLDIRFPVFILITKCDLLSGFREFFDDLSDAQGQQQMIGWSNRDDRDAIFDPSKVTDYIGEVVKRVQKRRFSLLRDPIPQKGEERRADEVDALYGLPQSMSLIAPRLRTYLEKIFVAGPWSPKPLFLRGIYFNSSMREGSALDQELAQALGLHLDELKEKKMWEREKSYFLKDLFTEKVFKERGLVTRATNTRKMLRTRSVVLWGTGTALALLFIGSSFYFSKQLEKSIDEQSRYWSAGKEWERPAIWKPLLAAETPGVTKAAYQGELVALSTAEGDISRLAFHDKLKDLADQELKTGWVFKWLLKWVRVDGDRKRAQRIVFEGGVVHPLVRTARERMITENPEDAPDKTLSTGARLQREANALAALIRIEDSALSKERANIDALPKGVIEPLLTYALASADSLNENALSEKDFRSLNSALIRTYSDSSKAPWPPPWLPLGSVKLAENQPIERGLQRLQVLAAESAKSQEEGLKVIQDLRTDLRAFRATEAAMDSNARLPADKDQGVGKLSELLADLGVHKIAIDKRVNEARTKGLFTGQTVVLRGVYDRLVGDSQAGASGSFKVVKEAVKPQVQNERQRLFAEVDQTLDRTLAGLKEKIAQGFNEQEIKELDELDKLLADYGNGQLNYQVRWDFYEKAEQQARIEDPTKGLVGSQWKSFAAVREAILALKSQIEPASQKLVEPFRAPCEYLLKNAERPRLDRLSKAYVNELYSSFDDSVFSPWVSGVGSAPKKGAVSDPSRLFDTWRRDFESANFKDVSEDVQTRLKSFASQLDIILKSQADRVEEDKKLDADFVKQKAKYRVNYSYSPAQNGKFWLIFRKVTTGGRTQSTDFDSFEGELSMGQSFSATFYRLPGQPSAPVSISAEKLKSTGGNLSVDGIPLHLNVSSEGQYPERPPSTAPRAPDKQRILRILK